VSDFTAFLLAAIEAEFIDGSWLSLYTDATTEASFDGYGRQQLSMAEGENDATVSVTNEGGGGVTLTHAALWDAETMGDRLTAIKALAAPITLAGSDIIDFEAGTITVAEPA
jgi:hypothetical protein